MEISLDPDVVSAVKLVLASGILLIRILVLSLRLLIPTIVAFELSREKCWCMGVVCSSLLGVTMLKLVVRNSGVIWLRNLSMLGLANLVIGLVRRVRVMLDSDAFYVCRSTSPLATVYRP